MSDIPGLPYKGLNPYSEADEPLFFGRETDTENIIDNLEVRRLTIFYGDSGVGKSSVLRAGVAHQLRQRTLENLQKYKMPQSMVVVFPPDPPASEQDNDGTYFSWQDEPMTALKQQIEKDIKNILPNVRSPEPSLSFVETLKAWTEELGGQSGFGELFIILDQFEEYFLYHPQEDGQGTFFTEFPRAVNRTNLRVNFLLSIREDSLAKLDRFKGKIPILFDNRLCIEHLDRHSATDAIKKPIEDYYNHRVPPELSVKVEPELVEEVLQQISQDQDDLKGGNGLGGLEKQKTQSETRIAAPYLQLVMTRLWEEEMKINSRSLRLETLTKLHGVKRIVKEHLNGAIAALSNTEKDIAAKIFQYLVSPSGTKYAYSVRDLAEFSGCPLGDLTYLLEEKLASGKQRIVRAEGSSSNQYPEAKRYSIFHDVLAQPILNWRKNYLQKKELEEKLQLQEQKLEEERHQRRLVVMKGLSDAALHQQGHGQDERVALLACQAYRFHQQHQLGVLAQVDNALRRALSVPNFSNILRYSSAILSVAVSPDGQTIAAGSHDETVLLWNRFCPSDPKKLKGHTLRVNAIAFSPDGQTLASVSDDKTIRLWNWQQDEPSSKILGFHDKAVTCVAFSPDGKFLASGSEDKTIRLWNWRQHEPSSKILGFHDKAVTCVAFSPDGQTLASGSDDRTIQIWDVKDPESKPIVRYGHEEMVRSVAFSRDGQILASASDDWTVRLWDLTQPKSAPRVLQEHREKVRAVAFSPDGRMLASASEDQTIRLWDTQQLGKPPKVLRGHYFDILAIAFSPDSQMLASSSGDNTLRIWDLQAAIALPRLFHGHQERVRTVAFSPDGQLLASGGEDKTVCLWKLNSPEAPFKVLQGVGRVFRVTFFFSKDHQVQLLVAGSSDNKVRIWDLHHLDAEPRILKGHTDGVGSVAFSPDGRWLASGSWAKDKTIKLWDLNQPNPDPIDLKGKEHTDSVTSLKFSPDGKTLASGSDDCTIRLWDLQKLESEPRILKDHNGRVWSVAFSSDGQMLASGSDDWTVRLWDLRNFNPDNPVQIILRGHNTWVSSVAFSPDDKILASCSYDRSIRLWNLSQLDWNSQQLKEAPIVLEDHNQSVTSVTFSPDGKWLASASYDGTVRLWMVSTDTLADIVCNKVLRNLTREEWQQFIGDDIPYEPTCSNLPFAKDLKT